MFKTIIDLGIYVAYLFFHVNENTECLYYTIIIVPNGRGRNRICEHRDIVIKSGSNQRTD